VERRRVVGSLLAVLVALAAAGVGAVGWSAGGESPASAATPLVVPGGSGDALASFLGTRTGPRTSEPVSGPASQPSPVPPADPEPVDARRAAFEQLFPAQAAAEVGGDPGEDAWAVLIGINEHLGAVTDNFVSREDAERLRALLLREGWSDERIVLLTDTDATGDMIRESLDWLARKAGERSTVVVHYSGHSRKWYDAGGRIEDQALWPTDDDFVRRDELADALDEVEHAAMWGNVASCEAAGFALPGVTGPGRVWTFSSGADEKSYEDPEAGHSVWGMFLLDHGLWRADEVTPAIQDAFVDAAAGAATYTSLQVPYGPQRPVLDDQLGRPFSLSAVPTRITPDVAD
jgi:hypothetical protein